MNDTYTIKVDQREKKPLLFPDHLDLLSDACLPAQRRTKRVHIRIKQATLPTGDYLLEQAPSCVIVERKAHLNELATNLFTTDRRRFIRALDRLAEAASRPILLVEGTVAQLVKGPIRLKQKTDPWLVIDSLQRLCLARNIDIRYQPSSSPRQRRVVGVEIARLLINGLIQ